MKALVIGGTGFVGVAACKELMRRGVETIATSRTAHPYGTFTSHIAFDRTDEQRVVRVLDEVQPEVVIDLACTVPVEVDAVARHFRGRRYVLMSCANGAPLKRWTVIRSGAVFGAGDPSMRIAAYLRPIEDGAPLLVPQETWEQPAGLAWVRDVGYALALTADLRKPVDAKAYDVGFEGVSLRRLIETLATAMRRRPQIVPVPAAELPEGASPYASTFRGIEPARRDLGFEPSPLQDAIAETLAWYRVASRRR